MTKSIIGRGYLGVWFLVLTFVFTTAFSPADIEAAKRKKKKSKKASHSVVKKNKRSAKLSSRQTPRFAPLTADEKTEIIEKITSMASAEEVKEMPSITDGGVNEEVDLLPADIAQAAKEEQEEDDVDVSIDKFFASRQFDILDPETAKQRQSDYTLFDEFDPKTAANRSDVMQHIIDWLGTRYHFGGLSRDGIDCSAFVREVFRKSFNVELPRTASLQSNLGERVVKYDDLQFGDLVFFHTANYARVTHVGIYIGEGLFANSSCSKGVTVSSLESTYWKKRYLFSRRLFTNTQTASREIQEALKLASNENDKSVSMAN